MCIRNVLCTGFVWFAGGRIALSGRIYRIQEVRNLSVASTQLHILN